MATPGTMIQVAAQALRLPDTTVALFYRAIREDGLVKTGGRGRSAAQVSALDVARLLISIMASELVRDAPQSVRVFGNLRESRSEVDKERQLSGAKLGLDAGHRFEDALVAVLLTLATPTWQQPEAGQSELIYHFEVVVQIEDLQATLYTTDKASLNYTHQPGSPGEGNEGDYGLRVRKSLGGPALLLLASLVAAPA